MFVANLSVYRKMTKRRSENLAGAVFALLPKGGRVLDFGCGNGYLAEAVLERSPGVEFVGVDVIRDQNLDDRILQNGRFSFQIIVPDARLPFADGAFDAVIACASMHHTNSPEFYLAELRRVTKVGGHVVLVEEMYLNFLDKVYISAQDWVFNKLKKGVPVPLQFRSLKAYTRLFGELGLEVVYKGSVRPVFPYMHHYIFRLRKG